MGENLDISFKQFKALLCLNEIGKLIGSFRIRDEIKAKEYNREALVSHIEKNFRLTKDEANEVIDKFLMEVKNG